MVETDAAWANVAFRVSRELNERDRRKLTRLAMEYLRDEEESDPS